MTYCHTSRRPETPSTCSVARRMASDSSTPTFRRCPPRRRPDEAPTTHHASFRTRGAAMSPAEVDDPLGRLAATRLGAVLSEPAQRREMLYAALTEHPDPVLRELGSVAAYRSVLQRGLDAMTSFDIERVAAAAEAAEDRHQPGRDEPSASGAANDRQSRR